MAYSGSRGWMRTIAALARQVVREGMRQHVVVGFCVAYALFVGGTGILRTLHFGHEQLEFVTRLGLAGASLAGALCTIVLTVHFFLGEFEDGAALVLFTKPVTLFDYVLGKWFGTTVLLGGFFGWVAVVLVLQLHLTGVAARGEGMQHLRLEIIAGCILEWIKCGLLCAAVQCVAAFLRTRVLATLTGLVVLVLCHVRPLLDEAVARIGPPLVRMAIKALVRMVPDFRFLDLDWGESGAISAALPAVAVSTAYGIVYLVGLLLVGGLILRRREL